MAKWDILQQGGKRRKSNQNTSARSNAAKNTKSTDTRANSGKPAPKPAPKPAAKPAPKAAPKAKPKTVYFRSKDDAKPVYRNPARTTRKPQNTTVQKAKNSVVYYTNKDKTPQELATNRLAKQKATAQVLTGKQSPLPPKMATRMGQTLNPVEQLKTDAKLGRENWISRTSVPSKPLTAEERKKKTQQSAQQSGFRARAKKQQLSEADSNLPTGPRNQIQWAKERFEEAKGDSEAMVKAHREAENIRYIYGYSGGASGNDYITGNLTQDDYNRLNPSGQKAMSQAKLARNKATTEEEIARADRRIAEILNAPGFQSGRRIDTERGMRETAEGRSTMLGATQAQKAEDARRDIAAAKSIPYGWAGTAASAFETGVQANADMLTRTNMEKWLRDADDYVSAKSDLEYYDNYVQTFGEPPAGMNRNALVIRLNNAIQARAQLKRMWTDPQSAWYDATQARRLGTPDVDAYSLTGRGNLDSPMQAMYKAGTHLDFENPEPTLGDRLLGKRDELVEEAMEGRSGLDRAVTELALTVGDSAPKMMLGMIPGVGTALAATSFGVGSAGEKAYELKQRGVPSEERALRALISGGIEAGTNVIPVEHFAGTVLGRLGKNGLKNMGVQSVEEAIQEGASYALNAGADYLANDPEASFSLQELAKNMAMGAASGAVFGTVGSFISAGHATSPIGAQSEEIQENAGRALTGIEATQNAETQIRTEAAQRLREDAQAYNEMKKAGVWSPAEEAQVKEALDQRYAEIAGAQTARRTAAPVPAAEPLTQVFADGMERNQAAQTRAPAVSAPTPLVTTQRQEENPVTVNPVEQAKRMTAEALDATRTEMARREAAQTVQAEMPPVQWERSGLPPTSFLGAAIDARRESRARAEAEAQVRMDQEIARQNRVAAEAAPNAVPTAPQVSPNVEAGQKTQQPVSRLEGLASTFGESGAASLRTIGGKIVTGRGAFVRDFTNVYNQVLGGRTERQVSRPAGMSDANFFAAVTAAKNDRQTGWDLDILKASKAAGRNVNAGVDWRDQYVRQMDRKTARIVDGLAKALGVKVVFAEQGSILTAGGARANAEITGNVVRIEKGNPNPVRMLIGHELTHRMQDLSPESYRAFRDYVMSIPGSLEALERTVSLYQGAKAFRAEDNVRQMAMDEVTADYAGALLENSEQLQEFIRRNYENRTMLEVIRDFFQDLAAKLSGREKAQADEAVRLLEEAIKGASERMKGMDRMTVADEARELSDVNTLYSIRKEDPPEKTGIAYKVFYAKNGQLYPPMVANPGGEGTPVGVWLNADVGQQAAPSKSGRPQVKAGGKGTQGGSGSLAFRPGWHLGDVPQATQFARMNPETGKKELFPANFVWAECEYAADVDYQDEAMSYGYTENGKFRHSYAGLPRLPENGYYRYRTNPKPDTVPWIITGAMKVKRILTDSETDAICRENGVEPLARQGGPLTAERMEKELGIKAGDTTEGRTRFSLSVDNQDRELSKEQAKYFKDSKVRDKDGKLLTVYHGTAADFTVFDPARSGENFDGWSQMGKGLYFTPDKKFAQYFAEEAGRGKPTKLMEGYLNVTNPFNVLNEVDFDISDLKKEFNLTEFDVSFLKRAGYRLIDFLQEHEKDVPSYVQGKGYDGIWDATSRKVTQIVAYDSNQFKNTDNKNPTGDKDIRFSLSAPVEETDTLVALHNLNETKMSKALDLGGFPMPSIAVTRKDIPHTNFGDISLVMSRDTVDPKKSRKNTVYSADAWTPTFPTIEYEADSKVENRVYRELTRLLDGVDSNASGSAWQYASNLGDMLNRHGGVEGLIDAAADSLGMQAAYARSKGVDIPGPETRETVTRMAQNQIDLYDSIIEALGEDAVQNIRKPDSFLGRGSEWRKQWQSEHGEKLKAALRDFSRKNAPNLTDEQVNAGIENMKVLTMQQMVREARDYLRNGPEKRSTAMDYSKMQETIRDAVDQEGFRAWLEDMYDGVVKDSGVYNNKDPYTPSGNRRTFKQTHYPVTLENIVKAMAGQNGGSTKNVSGFHGIKTLRAGTAKRFKSIKEMHDLEGRLQHLTPEEAKQINDALSDRMVDIMNRISGEDSGDFFSHMTRLDAIGETMVEIAESGNYTIENIVKIFGKYQYKISNDLAQEIKELLFDTSQMPVNIFEAKPERAVRFGEVLAAVVPSDMDAGLRGRMEEAGMRLIDYDRDNEQSRMDAVNSVEGARFSISPQADADYMAAVESGDMETAQRMVDEAAKKAGYTVKGYHGTAEKFTVFDKNKINSVWGINGGDLGFYFTPYEDDAKEYASYASGSREGTVVNAYLKMDNPLVDEDEGWGSAVRQADMQNGDLRRWAKQGNHDGIIVRSTDIEMDDGPDTVYIVFSPDQIKSADPVTYDDDGNVIPLSERFNEKSDDIRFSLSGPESLDSVRLMRENQLLREKLDYWKGQTKRSDRTKADPKEVSKLAKTLAKDFSTEMDSKDIAARLQTIYDGIGKDWSYDRAYEEAGKLARDMIEQASETDDYLYAQYEPMRKFFQDTALVVTPEMKRAIPDYGEWRKAQFGKVRLQSGDQTNVDQVFQEAAQLWPEWFSEDVNSNSLDQLERIVEVMDGVYTRDEVNPFEDDMAAPAGYLAAEIMDRFWDIPAVKKTFADRAEERVLRQKMKTDEAKAAGRERVQAVREQKNQKIKEARAEARAEERARMQAKNDRKIREFEVNAAWHEGKSLLEAEWVAAKRRHERNKKYKQALQRVRENRDKKLKQQKEKYLGREKANRTKQKEREKRAQILRHIRNLQQRLEKGTDKKNVPKDLRGIAITLLESVNTASKDMKQTKRTQDFVGLRDRLQEMRSDGSPIVLDESLFGDSTQGIQGNLDAVIAMQDIPIANMNLEQLDIVWKTVRAVEHAITTYNRTLASKKFAQTDAWADAIWTDSETKRSMKAIGMMLDLETPYTYFSQYGDSMLSVYRMLRDAQDLEQRRVDEIAEKTRKIINPKKVKAWGEHRNTFDVTWTEATDDGIEERSTTLTLTDSQIMDLYLLSRRPQAQEHLLKGGIVQPEIKTGRKKIDRGNEAIPLTAEKIGEITAKLSDEQVDVAKKLQKLTSDMAKWGNEASLNVYGYEKFTEDNYWPIRTAAEGIHSSVENNRSNPRSIKNIGLAKTTVPHASNPVDLSSVFDNFGRHASEMITYATWLAPMEDANRLYNWTFRDADNQKTGRTIKGMLDRVGGKGAKDYWSNLMKDIQNGLAGDSDTWIGRKINRIIGNAKGAAVGANIRVVIQQPTAMVRANAVMNPADLAAGIFAAPTKGSGWKKAKKWAGIAARKDAGGFDVSSPARSGKTYFGQQTGLEWFSDKAGALAGFADAVTWGRLWNAAEWQVARQNKDLTKGSAEYYRKVAEVFTNVIDQTQVVDGVLQRSQIMRSSNEIVKQATAFMGEPIMGLNMIIRNWNNWRYQTDPKKRTAARKALAKASTAFVATAVVNALAQAVVDGLRDDDKDREYHEKLIAAFLGTDLEGAKALAASIMDAAKNDEPDTTFAQRLAAAYAERMSDEDAKWGKDLKEAMLNGNLAENLNPMGSIPFVSDILSMFKGYDVTRADADVVADVIKKGQYWIESMEGDGKQTKWYATAQLAAQVGKLFGIPGHTIIRDVSGGLRTFAQKTGNIPMMYELEKAIYSTGSSKNKKLFESIAWAALKDGDLDTFNHIREDLMENGITDGKKLDNAMKKLAEANPDVELTQHIRDLIGVHPTFATKEEEEEAKFGADSLDGVQYAAYSEQRANTYRPLEDRLVSTDAFARMDDEAKDKALKTLWDYADKTALEDHSGGQYVADSTTITGIREAEAVGIAPSDYLIIKTAADAAQGIPDADGNTITNSLGIAKMEALDNSGIQLTAEQRAFMLDKIGVGKSVASFNADNLAKEKEIIQAKADAPSTLSILGEGNEGTVQQYTEFLETVVSDYDSNGKEIKGHKKQDKIIQYIKDIPGLSREQRSALYHMQYESDANNPWA